jgi:hypothetical protein
MPQIVLWPPPWKRSFVGSGLLTVAYVLLVVVPATLIATLVVLLVVKPYEYFANRNAGPRMTPWQVANIIERAATSKVDDDEWDDFTCVPMRDARLDAAVTRAAQIIDHDRPAGRISQDDAQQELRQMARELRGWDV